jgi:glutamate synthase domain-containing protein 2
MARAPLAATMVGKTIGRRIQEGQIPVYVERFGSTAEEIFVTAPELMKKYKERYNKIPTGAMGLFSYFSRLSQGLRQLMAGNRKFNLSYISRDDIAALTKDAAEISGIPYITEVDREEVNKILKS